MDKITFFKRMEYQILSGKKTATIRDKSESHYIVGQIIEAFTYEENRKICQIKILSVEPVEFDALNREHAKAENLPFTFLLKWMIRKIYPTQSQFYFISFRVVD